MATFTFTPQYDDNPPEGVEINCASEARAIEEGRSFLDCVIDKRSNALQTASVRVGAGRLSREDVEWLGTWDWTPNGGWVWSPED
jgi:hypothetical protein